MSLTDVPMTTAREENISRFLKGIRWELKWLESLRGPSVMAYYGHCMDEKSPFTAVEGRLTKWAYLSEVR